MKRLATLTAEENAAWEFAFNEYLGAGQDEIEADRQAWKDLQAEFPRLREYDGARP
jgi:hypothetical protein